MLAASAGLGAFHGINPGMGWLFAVSYGLQEKSWRAIPRSMVPIAIGHELSVLPMAVVITLFASQVDRAVASTILAVVLVAFGVFLLLRKRHFRWVGMRLTPLQLAWWSFLMSMATGAGLMLAPVLVGGGGQDGSMALQTALGSQLWVAAVVALVHAAAMFVTATAVALLVYRVLGLAILRTAWINLDRIWALAFVGAGVFVWVH